MKKRITYLILVLAYSFFGCEISRDIKEETEPKPLKYKTEPKPLKYKTYVDTENLFIQAVLRTLQFSSLDIPWDDFTLRELVGIVQVIINRAKKENNNIRKVCLKILNETEESVRRTSFGSEDRLNKRSIEIMYSKYIADGFVYAPLKGDFFGFKNMKNMGSYLGKYIRIDRIAFTEIEH